MSKEKNRPEMVINDGAIKATIWKRDSSKGSFYATNFTKTYKDHDGNFQNSQSFSGTDLLKISELAKQSYQASRDLYYMQSHDEQESKPKERDHDRER